MSAAPKRDASFEHWRSVALRKAHLAAVVLAKPALRV